MGPPTQRANAVCCTHLHLVDRAVDEARDGRADGFPRARFPLRPNAVVARPVPHVVVVDRCAVGGRCRPRYREFPVAGGESRSAGCVGCLGGRRGTGAGRPARPTHAVPRPYLYLVDRAVDESRDRRARAGAVVAGVRPRAVVARPVLHVVVGDRFPVVGRSCPHYRELLIAYGECRSVGRYGRSHRRGTGAGRPARRAHAVLRQYPHLVDRAVDESHDGRARAGAGVVGVLPFGSAACLVLHIIVVDRCPVVVRCVPGYLDLPIAGDKRRGRRHCGNRCRCAGRQVRPARPAHAVPRPYLHLVARAVGESRDRRARAGAIVAGISPAGVAACLVPHIIVGDGSAVGGRGDPRYRELPIAYGECWGQGRCRPLSGCRCGTGAWRPVRPAQAVLRPHLNIVGLAVGDARNGRVRGCA